MRPLANKVLLLQLGVMVAGIIIAFCFFDMRSVKAAVAAGFIAFMPALAYARVVGRITVIASPSAALLTHLIAWILKLALTLILLIMVFHFLRNDLSVPFFFGAYISCLMSYGAALLFK